MADAKVKAFSAPMPLRAIGDERLAGADLRALACIAAHDRMSLKMGSGRGCIASHETLAAKIGCNYINLGKSIKKLVGLGYLVCEELPEDRRLHGYRIPAELYDYEESLSFHKPSADARAAVAVKVVGQTAHDAAEMVCQRVSEKQANSNGSPPQYISLSDERYSVETAKGYSSQEARHSSRAGFGSANRAASNDLAGGSEAPMLGKVARGTSAGAQQAIFERALKAGAFDGNDPALLEWIGWLETVCENHGGNGDPDGGRARRLLEEEAIERLSEDGFRRWQESMSARTVLPVDAMIGAVGEVHRQVAAFYATVNRAGQEALAKRCGITPRELRAFVEGRESLPIGKQSALRTEVRNMAA